MGAWKAGLPINFNVPCCATGLYGACLDSTRRRPDECRYAHQKKPSLPIGGVFRIGASLLTVTFAPDVLDSKLKKNQSPVLFRLAGFRSHPLRPNDPPHRSGQTLRPQLFGNLDWLVTDWSAAFQRIVRAGIGFTGAQPGCARAEEVGRRAVAGTPEASGAVLWRYDEG